jgi:hypothetical protein
MVIRRITAGSRTTPCASYVKVIILPLREGRKMRLRSSSKAVALTERIFRGGVMAERSPLPVICFAARANFDPPSRWGQANICGIMAQTPQEKERRKSRLSGMAEHVLTVLRAKRDAISEQVHDTEKKLANLRAAGEPGCGYRDPLPRSPRLHRPAQVQEAVLRP